MPAPRLGLIVLSLLISVPFAAARPGVVRVFEAKVHAAASAEAEVVGTLIEGQRISVSEEAEDGWYRVRLADGQTAWVHEEALYLPEQLPMGEAPEKPVAGPLAGSGPFALPLVDPQDPQGAGLRIDPAFGATPAPPPTIRDLPTPPSAPQPDALHFTDYDLLLEHASAEPNLAADVQALRSDATISRWFFWGGLSAAVLLAGVPFIVHRTKSESMPMGYAYGASGLLVAAALGSLVYEPDGEDLQRIAQKWNTLNPDRPISTGGEKP